MKDFYNHKKSRDTLDKKLLFNQIRNGLIVSCQAEEDSPFNNPDDVAKFAVAAINGGASAIRSAGLEKTKKIIEKVNVPVIGLTKSYFDDGLVCITRNFDDVKNLIKIGTNIIAIDGTKRLLNNLSGPQFIYKIKNEFDCIVMADIAKLDEALECIQAGADCISTTLNGYTPETLKDKDNGCNFNLLKSVVKNSTVPVIAEGRFNTPKEAAKAIKSGAWAVVVGTAITRPHVITSWFSKEIKNAF
jgi:N-acylglucosamine-6-phosphate 2-epimerase